MNRKRVVVTLVVAVLALLVPLGAIALAPRQQGGEGVPGQMTYQGYLTNAQGTPIAGNVDLQFEIQDEGGASEWSETHNGVELADGYFSVDLGGTNPLTSTVFADPDRWLQVSVGGEAMDRQKIAAVPYAFQAASVPWSGLTGVPDGFADGIDDVGGQYSHVVVVAKSGGHHTSIQAAIDSITDAAAESRYLVWVAPGTYTETVTMKPYVHLQGAGQGATIVASTATGESPPGATISLARDTSLRDLTVINVGTTSRAAALSASGGVIDVMVSDVTAHAQGTATENYGVYLSSGVSGVQVRLQNVTAIGENGATNNHGLYNDGSSGDALVTLFGGSFTGRGGSGFAYGILNTGAHSDLEAENVVALGTLADGDVSNNFALSNENGATAMLRGGSYTGRNGSHARGIRNQQNARLEMESVTVLAQDATDTNMGVVNRDGATAVLRGGSFFGRGGDRAIGVHNYAATVSVEWATVQGENGTNESRGFSNGSGGHASLAGGAFVSQGSSGTKYGIYNETDSNVNIAQSILTGEGTGTLYSVYNDGTVNVAHSLLVSEIGGGGTTSCTAVSRGSTFSASGCP